MYFTVHWHWSFLDVWKFWILESAGQGHIWESNSMSGEIFKSSVRYQDSQEGGDYQERWSGAHDDRKQGPTVHQASVPHCK